MMLCTSFRAFWVALSEGMNECRRPAWDPTASPASFPCFPSEAKQAHVFWTAGFGFALSSPWHVKDGPDPVGTQVSEPLKPGSGTKRQLGGFPPLPPFFFQHC